ncbi:PfkB family carbohydrate kinase [Cellulomonas hominis]
MPALLVCCGLATLDVLQTVERVPRPDEKVVATGLDVTFGGPAANAAATAVALGVPAVLVTALGSGPVADLVRGGLEAAGVTVVDLLDGAPGSPPVSTVLVTRATGERAVASVNATGVGDLAGVARERCAELLAGATALLVDGHLIGAATVLGQAARAASIPVVLDGGSWKPGLDTLLSHVDHAVLSADFRLPDDDFRLPVDGVAGAGVELTAGAGAEPVEGAGAGPGSVGGAGGGPVVGAGSAGGSAAGSADLVALAERWPVRTVARSAGAGPVRWLLDDGRTGQVPVPQVPAAEVVDTLGAGDVLHGAFAAAIARGTPFEQSLTEAVHRATDSIRHRGAYGWATPYP